MIQRVDISSNGVQTKERWVVALDELMLHEKEHSDGTRYYVHSHLAMMEISQETHLKLLTLISSSVVSILS